MIQPESIGCKGDWTSINTCCGRCAVSVADHDFKSWAAEVVADQSGKWCGNALRFDTREAAQGYVMDLANRWSLVRSVRTVPSQDAPTHTWDRWATKAIDTHS